MDRPNEIQMVLTEHSIDAAAAAALLCPPGVVMVEMLPAPEKLRGLFLPDQVSADCRPDIGVVLACGHDVPLCPGDTVAVRPYDGQWLDGFSAGPYATANQVRVYGKFTPNLGVVDRSPWDVSIPLQIFPETEDMTATNRNLIVRREPPVTTEGMLDLPDFATYRTGLAEVLSVGPKCDLALVGGVVQAGDRIQYDTRAELEFAFGGDPDLAIIPDLAVNFVIRADAVAA